VTDAPERELLSLEPIADDPEVGRWLAAMEDCRRDTLAALDGAGDDSLDLVPAGSDNSLGTILYHVALVEADWLLADIFGHESAGAAEPTLLPFADRDEAGQLAAVRGETLAQHLERLAEVRKILLDRLRSMPSADFHRPRSRERYDVTPAWVVHHLLQHEAEHRSEIVRLRAQLDRA
jgi:uncharacterized damage-inducible protein DinB